MKNNIIILFLLLNYYGFSQDIIISTQPSSIRECFGNSTSFYVLAYSESKKELQYQWYKDDTKLIGSNSPLLEFKNLNHNNTGLYFCEISNNQEIIRTNVAPIYVLRSTSITKEPEDVITYLDEANVSLDFEAHVNGKSVEEAIINGDLVNIQWYQKIENNEIKLENNHIYDGVNSSRLNINTKSLADTNYYFAEVEGVCGKARTRIVKIIKNLILLDLTIHGLEACEGNFETIKANVNNPNNYELEFQWYKNDKAVHYKENLDGYYTDELKLNPIHLLDSGIYKLEAKIKGTTYSVFSNEVKVNLCSKPEIIAVRIDTISGNYVYRFKTFNYFMVFYKTNCQSIIKLFKNDSLVKIRETENDKLNGYNIPYKNYGYTMFDYELNNDAKNDDKFHIEIENYCGTVISDTLTIAQDLNVFTNRDPWGQYRELCEDDTTTLEFYFHNQPLDFDIRYWIASHDNILERIYDRFKSEHYEVLNNKFHFKKLRFSDNGIYNFIVGFEDHLKKTMVSPAFLLKVNRIPHIKKQPINKQLKYGKKDTLFYILFDNDKQIPMSLDLYYMASLTSKPRLIDKSEAEWGLWYRYIKDVTFADRGYYYAVSKHYNDCKSVVSDTIYIDVLPEGITSIDEIENNRLIISPNPATEYITLNCKSSNGFEISSIVIYDIMGVKIDMTEFNIIQVHSENGIRIDASKLNTGVYFVKIVGSNGACSIVEKFVKM